MKKNKIAILPDKMVEKLNQISSNTMRHHAIQFCSAMLSRIEKDNLLLASYIGLKADYIRENISYRYNDWMNQLFDLGIIRKYQYVPKMTIENPKEGIRGIKFKNVEYIVGQESIKYGFCPEILTENFVSILYSVEEKSKNTKLDKLFIETTIEQLEEFTYDKDSLLNKIDEVTEIFLNKLKIIDKNSGVNFMQKLSKDGNPGIFKNQLFNDINYTKKSDEQIFQIKEGRYHVGKFENYKIEKLKQLKFIYKRNLEKLFCNSINPIRNLTNGRLDYNLTNINKYFLKDILQTNNKIEIDLSNSQYAIFSNLLELSYSLFSLYLSNESVSFSELYSSYTSYLPSSSPSLYIYISHYDVQFLSNPAVMQVVEMFFLTFVYINDVQFSDLSKIAHGNDVQFSDLCFSGKIYNYINEKLHIDSAKLLMMQVFFATDRENDSRRMLETMFPNMILFIDKFKELHGRNFVMQQREITGNEKYDKSHAVLAVSLQKVEAVLFIDTIYSLLIKKGYKCLPKHDSLIIDKDKKDEVMSIIKEVFDSIGFKGSFKIDGKEPIPPVSSAIPEIIMPKRENILSIISKVRNKLSSDPMLPTEEELKGVREISEIVKRVNNKK